MTVANIFIEDDRIRIVSDTVLYANKQPVMFVESKVAFDSDKRLAVITRGRVWQGERVNAMALGPWSGFDEAVEAARYQMDVFRADGLPLEATVCGMDGDKARAVALFLPAGGDEVQTLDLTPGVYLRPSLGRYEFPRASSIDDLQLARLAFAQQQLSKEHGLNMCVGGDVQVTTISNEGVTQAKLCEYRDKAIVAKRMNAASQIDKEYMAA